MKGWRRFLLWLLEAATNGLAWFGVFFIGYGAATQSGFLFEYEAVEQTAAWLSAALTLLGTALTAASVWFFSPNPPPPEEKSKNYVAPNVILACCICLGASWWTEIPPVTVNGFAILGLAGCLFRLRPNPGPPAGAN